MSNLTLHIELLSPLCCGSGFSRTGYVDRDVVFDEAGLPYIPGRRLKGLCRDAYRQIVGPLKLSPDPKTMFGEPGATMPGMVTIGNATIQDADEIRAWALQIFRGSGHTFNRDDIIDYFTDIRRQTAMDRRTGAPEEHTLRSTRVLRERLKFSAEVQIEDIHKDAFQLAAKGVQFMGTSRSRGLGHVLCFAAVPAKPGRSKAAAQYSTSSKANDSVLSFSLRLDQPALFPGSGGDPNTMLTHHCVPGSTVRGFLARRYLKGNSNAVDGQFYELFCSGNVHFLPANPEILTDAGSQRSVPMAHSIRVEKHYDQGFHDLTCSAPGHEPLRRVPGWTLYSKLNAGGNVPSTDVMTELQYHHQRAHDPRIGKAVGAEQAGEYGVKAEEVGALFAYEALCAGQRFRGEITGPPQQLQVIRKLIEDEGERVYIGRSKSAQYGGAAFWRWEIPTPRQIPEVSSGDTIIVTLEAPLLAISANGHAGARFPVEELSSELGVSLTLEKAFARSHWQNGYLGHQLLPRQQVPALAAGSVFVFKASPPPSLERIQAAQDHYYGHRIEEGFGKIALCPAPPAERLTISSSPPVPAKAGLNVESSSEAGRMATEILRRQFKEAVRAYALNLASQVSDEQLARINPHLVHRIMFLLESNPQGLTRLADRIVRLLKSWMVRSNLSLLEFVTNDWREIFKQLHADKSPVWQLKPDWFEVLKDPFIGAEQDGHAEAQFATELVAYYRIRFLYGLLWRKQQLAKKATGKKTVTA